MPNEVGSSTRSVAIAAARSVAVGSSIVVVGCGWDAKGRWWRREGGANERGRAKAKRRLNRLMAKAATATS
nr:hypothetical protein CFP56_35252 [Quercus suber]